MNDNVHDAGISCDFVRWNKTGENKFVCQPEFTGFVFESMPPFAATDEKKFYSRTLPEQIPRDGKQIIMALQLDQPRDFSDDDVVARDFQPLAKFRIIFRREKRLQIKAAEDFCELFSSSDPSGEILARHRFSNSDEVGRDFRNATLSGAKNKIRERILKCAKGRAVNRMNDDRHPCPRSRESAKNAGFAAVRVNDVWFRFAKNSFEPLQRAPIFKGMNWPH